MYGGKSGSHTNSLTADVTLSCIKSFESQNVDAQLYDISIRNVTIRNGDTSPQILDDKKFEKRFRFVRDLSGQIQGVEVDSGDKDEQIVRIKKSIAEVYFYIYYYEFIIK